MLGRGAGGDGEPRHAGWNELRPDPEASRPARAQSAKRADATGPGQIRLWQRRGRRRAHG
eukprot:114932-Pyramimonas_sp.AAC.1